MAARSDGLPPEKAVDEKYEAAKEVLRDDLRKVKELFESRGQLCDHLEDALEVAAFMTECDRERVQWAGAMMHQILGVAIKGTREEMDGLYLAIVEVQKKARPDARTVEDVIDGKTQG